jgi:hypothetical protein
MRRPAFLTRRRAFLPWVVASLARKETFVTPRHASTCLTDGRRRLRDGTTPLTNALRRLREGPTCLGGAFTSLGDERIQWMRASTPLGGVGPSWMDARIQGIRAPIHEIPCVPLEGNAPIQ